MPSTAKSREPSAHSLRQLVHVRLDPEQVTALEALARDRDVSVANLVRRAVKSYLSDLTRDR